MIFSKLSSLVILSCLPGCFYAQEDTTEIIKTQSIQRIDIIRPMPIVRFLPLEFGINKKDIAQLGTDDLGELLSKLPGTTIKSYGGLGGLKSASIRGLGGQHTSVVFDMFDVSNSQSGQVNFAQVQTEGLEHLSIRFTPNIADLTPVSTQFSGAQLRAQSFMSNYGNADSKMKVIGRYGSFGRKEVYLDGEVKHKEWHFAGFGKFRDAVGDYPFQTMNGSSEISSTRNNNDYRDFYYGGKMGKTLSTGNMFNVMYRGSSISQGLPGAVILYNETADERLTTQDHRLMGEYLFNKPRRSGRLHASGAYNRLTYDDPSYLNAEGKLHQQYDNLGLSVGYLERFIWNAWRFKWGGEQKVDLLQSNRSELGQPLRAATHLMGGFNYRINHFVYEVFLGGQFIYDQNTESNVDTKVQLTPVLNIEWRVKPDKWFLSAWYKRTFRMPSFNELYFGSVGNLNLKPEIAHQTSLDVRYVPFSYFKKQHLEIFGSAFFNEVTNKIVAIPTKNLFVWSMQNVEHARIYGTSVGGRYVLPLVKECQVELQGSYTWQRVIDVGLQSLTKGHQIAYAPEHVGNVDLVFKRKELVFRVSNNAVSSRYALNQNVSQNLLKGYWVTDATLGYRFIFKNEDVLGAQINLKNVWNTPYAFIRSYAMPGRHFLITLNYEIH